MGWSGNKYLPAIPWESDLPYTGLRVINSILTERMCFIESKMESGPVYIVDNSDSYLETIMEAIK